MICLTTPDKIITVDNKEYYRFRSRNIFDGTSHYYSLTDDIQNHLHVYERLRTGDSRLKQYDFTKLILAHNSDLNLQNITTILHFLRFYLKLANPYSLRKFIFEYKELKSLSDANLRKVEQISQKVQSEQPWISQVISLAKPHNKSFIKCLVTSYKIKNILKNTDMVTYKYRFPFFVFSVKLFYQCVLRFSLGDKTLDTSNRMICICGPDGAGKSSVAKILETRLSQRTAVTRLHYGLPNLTPLDRLKNELLFHDRKSKHQTAAKTYMKMSKKLYYLDLAYRRLRTVLIGKLLKSFGFIVIFDRYHNVEDSQAGVIDGRRLTSGFLSRLEQYIYNLTPKADLAIIVTASVETLVNRNRYRCKLNKESSSEIKKRLDEFAKYHPSTKRLRYLDTSELTVEETINKTLQCILLDQHQSNTKI